MQILRPVQLVVLAVEGKTGSLLGTIQLWFTIWLPSGLQPRGKCFCVALNLPYRDRTKVLNSKRETFLIYLELPTNLENNFFFSVMFDEGKRSRVFSCIFPYRRKTVWCVYRKIENTSDLSALQFYVRQIPRNKEVALYCWNV